MLVQDYCWFDVTADAPTYPHQKKVFLMKLVDQERLGLASKNQHKIVLTR